MTAARCPVCYGTGKYTDPLDPMSTAVPMPRTCHGCAGKGWVEVHEDVSEVTVYYPPTYSICPDWWTTAAP
ncbi:MAG: hypothetical protein MUP81_01585 [Dehalococcoidia bacterium]|nr:hypothetical protein [Dehalococcoidia bacterium]